MMSDDLDKINDNTRKIRLLSKTKTFTPKIVRVKPVPAEGNDGDIAIGNTPEGMKLYVKLANRWHTFSPDKKVPTEKYKISNLTLDRTYNANSSSTAELADILGTLIHDLHKFGLLKYIKT
jgi:hypothetical protein